ncbi:MAG: alpha/beta hydrolase [Opitutaceae bacterium]|jgi:acetyl esterase/lipase|nr:alpha/beta hydrolase [Opitutaceae bacterium]
MRFTPPLFLRVSLLMLATHSFAAAQSDKMERIPDIPYADTDNPRQMLDVFLPTNRTSELLPVVVYIHGGGWRNGSKDRGNRSLAPLVSTGNYIGISVGYRLTNEAQWPSQIHDCKAAIRWIRAHAKTYGMDPDRIGIFGTSAGGHLVSMLGTSGDVPAMEGDLGPHTGESSRVTCVADLFGPTNFLLMNSTAAPGAKLDHDAAKSPESLLIGGAIQEHPQKVATANPITYVTPDDPPFLIIHGTLDPLVSYNQSEIFQTALNDAKVDNTLITVTDGGHGKGFPPATAEAMARFFDHHLRNIPSKWSDHAVAATPWR